MAEPNRENKPNGVRYINQVMSLLNTLRMPRKNEITVLADSPTVVSARPNTILKNTIGRISNLATAEKIFDGNKLRKNEEISVGPRCVDKLFKRMWLADMPKPGLNKFDMMSPIITAIETLIRI